MKPVAMFVMLLLLFSLVAVALATTSNPTVFRDLSWGDPVKALGAVHEVTTNDTEPGIQTYRKSPEMYALGAIPTGSIEYYFFEDQLKSIVVDSPGKDAKDEYDMFKRMLTAKYGKPKTRLLSHTLEWKQDDTVVFLHWAITGRVWFTLTSDSLQKAHSIWLDEYKDALAKKSAEAF